MKRYQITIDGHTFDVQFLSDPRQDTVQVEVDGETLIVGVGAGPAWSGEAVAVPAPAGDQAAAEVTASREPVEVTGSSVVAPLPGVIKSIAVRPGQQVSPGQELLVIEAMKMDNVIRAGRQGVVEAVHVAEGHRVAHGQIMMKYQG
jgi:biotin carboxyl carrier protein